MKTTTKTKQQIREESLDFLNSSRGEYIRLAREMLESANKTMFMFDLIIIAALERSFYLNLGFSKLIREENYFAAAPLIRLNLDNVLHTYAMFIVVNPHELAMNLMRGKKRLKDYRDKEGNLMTDRYLVRKFFEDSMNSEFLGLKDVYGETSKYIHFSEKHIMSIIDHIDEKNKSVEFKLFTEKFNISEKNEQEAIQAMIQITKAQLKYLIGWIVTKNNKQYDDKNTTSK
jgi:hypothetical protein